MPRRSSRRRRELPTALSMPFWAWGILLAAMCLFLAYVISQPLR
jgi:hypothetical protein